MSTPPPASDKPIHSAYYHGRTTTKGEEAERYKPQLIDPSTPIDEPTSPGVGSKWNKAQTFETSDFSQKQIIRTLNEVFTGYNFAHKVADVPILSLGGVDSVNGFASRTFTRGKMMLSFELTIKFNLQADGEPLADAVLTFAEVDFTCCDDFDIKYSGFGQNSYTKALRQHEDKLRIKFDQFIKAMLAIPDDDADYH